MKESLSQRVGALLTGAGKTLALAESCTGGWIANELTHIPGASHYFLGGVCVYSNTSKEALLDVPRKILDRFGSVSEETARAMAEGARQRFHSDYALSVTGIAGPEGGTKEKPVGTVYIALATSLGTETRHFCFLSEERVEFKKQVSETALEWLRQELSVGKETGA